MKIRKGTIKDIPKLVRLYSGVREIMDSPGDKKGSSYFRSFLKKGRVIIVAEIDKNIAGALNAELDDAGYLFLNNIVINPKFRGKGVATKLMFELEKITKKNKFKKIVFLVYESNKKMRNLVNKLKYKHGHKLLIYTKKL